MHNRIADSPAHARFRQTFSVAALTEKFSPTLKQSASAPASLTTCLSNCAGPQPLSPQLDSAIEVALSNAWSPGSKAIHRTAMKKIPSFL